MPAPPSSPLRPLLLTEATLKLLSATLFIACPRSILSRLTPAPHRPTATLLIRLLGTQTLAFAIPLLLAARSDAQSVASRRLAYCACLARETFLAAGLIGSIVLVSAGAGRADEEDGVDERSVEEGVAGEKRATAEDGAAERVMLLKGMGWWIVELVPFVVARTWALGWKKEWFE